MAKKNPSGPAFVRFRGTHPDGHIRAGDVCKNPDPRYLDCGVAWDEIDEATYRGARFLAFDAVHLERKPEEPPALAPKGGKKAAPAPEEPPSAPPAAEG
jgi:hypothetical protein